MWNISSIALFKKVQMGRLFSNGLFRKVLFSELAFSAVSRLTSKYPVILMYHRFGKQTPIKQFGSSDFVGQLEYLNKDYHVLSI